MINETRVRFVIANIAIVPFLLLPRLAVGDLVTYSDRSQFDSNAIGQISVVDFEGQATGNVNSGTTIDGVTFTYNFGGVKLRVIDSYDTTSGVKSLGTNDLDIFQDGDDISFSFSPITGFGLYIISGDPLLDGDLRLTVGSTMANLVAADLQDTLPDGSFVWFLGILSDDAGTFTSIDLTTHGGGGAFLYNLDDIAISNAIPEPSVAAFFSFCVIFVSVFAIRFRSTL